MDYTVPNILYCIRLQPTEKPILQKELMNGIFEAWEKRKALLDRISSMENQMNSSDSEATPVRSKHDNTSSPVNQTFNTLPSKNDGVGDPFFASVNPSITQSQAAGYTTSHQPTFNSFATSVNYPYQELGKDSSYSLSRSGDNSGASPKSYGTSGIQLLCDLLNGTLPEYPARPCTPSSAYNTGTTGSNKSSPVLGSRGVHSPNEQLKQTIDNFQGNRKSPGSDRRLNDSPSKTKAFRTNSPFSISSLVNTDETSCSPLAGTTPQSAAGKTSPAGGNSSLTYRHSVMDNRTTLNHRDSSSPLIPNSTTLPTKTRSPPSNFSIAHLTKDLKSPTGLNQDPSISFAAEQHQMYSRDNRANPPHPLLSTENSKKDTTMIRSHKDDRVELCHAPILTEPTSTGVSTKIVVADSPSTPTPKRRPGRPRKYPPKPKISRDSPKPKGMTAEVSSTLSPSKMISSSDNKQACPTSLSSLDSSDVEVSTLLAKEVEPQSPSISSSEHKTTLTEGLARTPGLVDSNPCSANSPIRMPSSPSLNSSQNVALPSFDATFSPTKKHLPVNLLDSEYKHEDR